MRVIGMMSGTSFDAVDAAAADLELDGDTVHLKPLGLVSQPYPTELRDALQAALPPAATTMEQVCRLDTGVGQAFAALAARAEEELCEGRAELVVSHGQTVYHWTAGAAVLGTLQLGQPAWIAEATGLPVLADLRVRDVAAGGQGAPLVSALDVLWLSGRGHVSAALNLGGIANVTIVGGAGQPVAFDAGPANALIDAAVQHATSGRASYDAEGRLAAAGRVDPALLEVMLAEPYYRRPPPKSTGKELFNLAYLQAATASRPDLGTEDVVATLTALTAQTVAEVVREAAAVEVVAAGGGTQNPVLMAMLRDRLPDVTLLTADELGLPSAAKEAYAFAFLGFCTVSGLPSTVPSCTGARHSSVLGSLTPGRNGFPVLGSPQVRSQPAGRAPTLIEPGVAVTAGSSSDPGTRIGAAGAQLSPAERRVARLMAENPARIAQLTASALAGEASTSAATVVRTAKSLGFDGYPQLRVALATQAGRAHGSGEPAEREVPRVADIETGDDVAAILAKLVAFERAQLLATAEVLSPAAVEVTATRLAAAGRCCVFGLGSSGLVAQDLVQKITRIGLTAFGHTEQEAAVVAASLLGRNDVAVAVSHSGETPGTIEPLRRARRSGAFTAAITGDPWSTLADHADQVLVTAGPELGRRSAAVGSRTSQLLVVDTLFARVAALAPGTAGALRQTHDAIVDTRSRSR